MIPSRRSVILNLLIILYFVSLNAVKGDVEDKDVRIKVVKGDRGKCSAKFQLETIEETCKHKEPCLQGPPGLPGDKGQKGDKGERGEAGERGKCEEKGTEENPVTSCVDSDKNDNPYIFAPSPFKVKCDYNDNSINFNNTKDLIKIDEVYNTTKEEPYWLWPDAIETDFFENFYGLEKSQVSHLISISDRVTLNLIFHCNNFELKDNIRILLWDNTLVGQNPTPTSPVTYTVPEDDNSCKNFRDPDLDDWRTATITIDTWAGVAKNFYIPAKTSDKERFYIQFKNIYFYF
ncbi:uncharacterized protein LOC121740400 [Aricia agestis]|uniref:uncharacterized protein LOC121740400 n=1 Tax=Aricia agestis TaxID=91739 RepID=UPI001C20B0DE|nr:uncharacterized protein LOC121740400 [Aricia agestis]